MFKKTQKQLRLVPEESKAIKIGSRKYIQTAAKQRTDDDDDDDDVFLSFSPSQPTSPYLLFHIFCYYYY